MADNDFRPFQEWMEKIQPQHPHREGKAPISQTDRQLFFSAINTLPPSNKTKGFLLADQCQLPRLEMKKKKALPPPPPSSPEKEETPEGLFAAAMRDTRPLTGKGRAVPSPRAFKPKKAIPEFTLADYFAEKLEFAISSTDEYMEGHVVGLDQLIMGRLRQGQFSPEAHLDLHGQNAEQAFESVKEFIRQAWFKGLHTLLIIPGRGKNSHNGMGILRQKLPYWLTHEPFKRVVLAFCTAQPHDGGPGSVYVLLRKAKKRGPVRWTTLAYYSEEI